ncbi:MAG TPA: hypothetical protein GX014_10790 [Firmicutes bacterium]|nr:hypothetical protein [Bacillota bacterium]HHT43870.1 hypothetical protein [Bacillota bacterium]
MRKVIRVLAVVLVLFCAVPARAVVPSGEVYGGVGAAWDHNQKEAVHTSTLTGFRIVLEDDVDSLGKLHFSTKGWYDWKQKDGKIAVDQLWLKGYYGDFDYQVGRQLISWGTADGFNPTNYFARLSSSALLSGDLSGDPLWAGKAEYYAPAWSATAVVIPVFQPQEIDAFMAQMLNDGGPYGAMILQAIEDAKKPLGIAKSELALRAETQLAGFDVQASYFWGYEPLPGLEMVLGPTGPSFEGTYRRQHFLGLAVAGTIGPAGVWAEAAYGGPEKFAQSDNPYEMRIPMSINERYLQVVLGGDYTLPVGSGLLVQAQYIYRGQGSLLAPYVMPKETMEPGDIEGAHYLYGRLAYDFSQDSTADLVAVYGNKEKGGILRPSYTHRFTNGIQLELSVIHPFGQGDFESITTQARLAVKYQF